MILEYMTKQIRKARFKKLEDGTYFAEIPGVRGVWANASSLRECRKELSEVLEGWLVLKLHNKERIPGFSMSLFSGRSSSHAP